VSMLSVRGLTKRFGGLTAIDGVDLDVARGEIVGVIGPNGAGKTTFFNLLTAIFPPTSHAAESAGPSRSSDRSAS